MVLRTHKNIFAILGAVEGGLQGPICRGEAAEAFYIMVRSWSGIRIGRTIYYIIMTSLKFSSRYRRTPISQMSSKCITTHPSIFGHSILGETTWSGPQGVLLYMECCSWCSHMPKCGQDLSQMGSGPVLSALVQSGNCWVWVDSSPSSCLI